MNEFDKKQIALLRGSYTNIGKVCGCTREYASKIISGKIITKREANAKKAEAVRAKAREILKVLTPSI